MPSNRPITEIEAAANRRLVEVGGRISLVCAIVSLIGMVIVLLFR